MGDGHLKIEFSGSHEEQAGLLSAMVRAGYKIIGFREEEADLEDVFLKLTTGAVQ
jgi:ABC-2 type transport system ATP-binding protein